MDPVKVRNEVVKEIVRLLNDTNEMRSFKAEILVDTIKNHLSETHFRQVIRKQKLAKLDDVYNLLKKYLSNNQLYEILAYIRPLLPENLKSFNMNWRQISKLKDYR